MDMTKLPHPRSWPLVDLMHLDYSHPVGCCVLHLIMLHSWAMPQSLGWVVKVGTRFHLLDDVSWLNHATVT